MGCVNISIIDDDVNEPEEFFRVRLASNNVQVVTEGGIVSADVFITDNDPLSSKY